MNLSHYPLFSEKIEGVETEKVVEYVKLFCDPKSELWQIKDYAKRKLEALKKADIDHRSPVGRAIKDDEHPKVIEMEVQYSTLVGGEKMAMYIALYKFFNQLCNRVAQPVKEMDDESKELKAWETKGKCSDDLEKVELRLSKLRGELFKDEASHKKIISHQPLLSPESRSKNSSVV